MPLVIEDVLFARYNIYDFLQSFVPNLQVPLTPVFIVINHPL